MEKDPSTDNDTNATAPAARAPVPVASQPPVGSQPVAEATYTYRSVKQVRIFNLVFMLLSVFTIPFLGHTLWAVILRPYKSSLVLRVIVGILSWIVGGVLTFIGLLGNMDTTGLPYWPFFIPGLLIYFGPFIHTFVWPRGRRP